MEKEIQIHDVASELSPVDPPLRSFPWKWPRFAGFLCFGFSSSNSPTRCPNSLPSVN